MTTLLAEQPLMVSIMLAALAVGLIYGWLQTGKTAAAGGGLVALLLIPVAWVVAANWQTDREQIKAMIEQTAEAVEKNDHERVYQVIGDRAAKAQARAELPNYVFDAARVTGIRSIDFIEGSYPPEADVDLNVRVSVRGRQVSVDGFLRRLILKLQKRGDDWLVVDYRHMPIAGGPDALTTVPQR